MADGSGVDGSEPDGSGVDGSGVDGSGVDADRPAAARPVRVVGFDDLGDTAGERAVRVAAFGDLDDSSSGNSRVASLDMVRRRTPPPADRAADDRAADDRAADDRAADDRAADDRPFVRPTRGPAEAPALDGGRRTRRTGTGGDRATGLGRDHADGADGADGRRGADSGALSAAGAPEVEPSDPDASGPSGPDPFAPGVDDGVPPDGPLPRGRRRGGRVGRLGPDAPDPDRPQPEADPVVVAREICLRLLTDRARTRQELAQALARKRVPAEAAATVLDRFDEVGLIDDVAFAEQWVRSRHAHRGLGRRAIAVELRRKGVADDVAGEALAEVDTESEARRARELVDRKLRSLTVDTAELRARAANRLVGMLARKGYGAGTAYGVVRQALADHGADADELTADPPG